MATETCKVTLGAPDVDNTNLVSDRRDYWVQKWTEMESGGKARIRVVPPSMYPGGAMFVHPPDGPGMRENARRDGRTQEEFWRKQWEERGDMPPELREKWDRMRKAGQTRQFWREEMEEWINNGEKEKDIPSWLPPMVREKWIEMEKRGVLREKWSEMEKRGDEFWKRFHKDWKDGEEHRERFFGKLWRKRKLENQKEGEPESDQPRRWCGPWGNWRKGPGCWRERYNNDDDQKPEKQTPSEKQVYKEFDVFDY